MLSVWFKCNRHGGVSPLRACCGRERARGRACRHLRLTDKTLAGSWSRRPSSTGTEPPCARASLPRCRVNELHGGARRRTHPLAPTPMPWSSIVILALSLTHLSGTQTNVGVSRICSFHLRVWKISLD